MNELYSVYLISKSETLHSSLQFLYVFRAVVTANSNLCEQFL